MRIEKKLDLLMERSNINQTFKPYAQSVATSTQKTQREQRQTNSIKRKEKARNPGSEMSKPPAASIPRNLKDISSRKEGRYRTEKRAGRTIKSQNLAIPTMGNVAQIQLEDIIKPNNSNGEMFDFKVLRNQNRLNTAGLNLPENESFAETSLRPIS